MLTIDVSDAALDGLSGMMLHTVTLRYPKGGDVFSVRPDELPNLGAILSEILPIILRNI